MSSPISPHSRRLRDLSRRELALGAGAFGLVAGLPAARAESDPQTPLAELIARITEAAVPVREKMIMEIPGLVENGNSVDLRVAVESPMSATEHVRWIHVIADKNPFPDMARFHLGPRAGLAEVATTLRLAASQTVTVVASLSDGSYRLADAPVVVTLSACIDGG